MVAAGIKKVAGTTQAAAPPEAADPPDVGRGTNATVVPFIPRGPLSGFIPVEGSILGEACVPAEALSATPAGDPAPVQAVSVTRAALVSNEVDSTMALRWRLWLGLRL